MMLDYAQELHSDYSGGWIGTTPATVLAEGLEDADIESVNPAASKRYTLPAEFAMLLGTLCNHAPILPKYDYYHTSWDLVNGILQEEFPGEKPRNTHEWLGLITANCLAGSEFLNGPALRAKSETYLVEERQEALFDEDLPVVLPPPVKSYTVKGRVVRVGKVKPTALPLEEAFLLGGDDIPMDDLPIRLPAVKSYKVKGKIK